MRNHQGSFSLPEEARSAWSCWELGRAVGAIWRRLGKERLVRFRIAFPSLLWRLRRFSGRFVENVAFSGCSVTILADLEHMGCFVDDYLLE